MNRPLFRWSLGVVGIVVKWSLSRLAMADVLPPTQSEMTAKRKSAANFRRRPSLLPQELSFSSPSNFSL